MDGWNTTFLLGRPIFRGYVSFREGSSFRKNLYIIQNVPSENVPSEKNHLEKKSIEFPVDIFFWIELTKIQPPILRASCWQKRASIDGS